MILILSLVTSVKDYLEIVHKFIEYDSVNINYNELGSILTYFLISIKNSFIDFLSFSWLLKENIWSLPIIIPEISSAMISEISVLNGYFHNAFNFLDTPVSFGTSTLVFQQNSFIACLEKLIIGIINSFFLFLPTSTAHIITVRRFVMQGLEAGYISGLGTIAGNVFWLGSVILGFRFFVIPWLGLDIFRYLLGFILLVKYMWDSYNEKNILSNGENGISSAFNQTKSSKNKIFLLNFLLALTEQTSIYPFISNISISPDASMLENFSLTSIQTGADSSNGFLYVGIHLAYLLGITAGSLSLLHLSCWFWENPAFKLYMWLISSFKVSTSFYYKVLNFLFLYLTMLSAISSIPYYGLDYTITNPLGYVNDDRLIQDKVVLETSFLGTKASDRNTRRNRGRHGRRERWKQRIRKYRTFDASLYDQGIYDLFTIEDLNYGFDRFWLRRKLRNHRVRFRFFPGPWMRSFKKQLAKPRLESYTGPRTEFFRILYEQVYHPAFHAYNFGGDTDQNSRKNLSKEKSFDEKTSKETQTSFVSNSIKVPSSILIKENKKNLNLDSSWNTQTLIRSPLHFQKSTIRKFIRKFDSRVKKGQIKLKSLNNVLLPPLKESLVVSKKSWLILNRDSSNNVDNRSKRFNLNIVTSWGDVNSRVQKQQKLITTLNPLDEKQQEVLLNSNLVKEGNFKKLKTYLSKKDSQILQYRALLTKSAYKNNTGVETNNNFEKSLMLLHPLKFYLQQETAFKRKLRYYTPNVYRKFSIDNNAPYYNVMMKRYFYHFKPNLRWERTMKVASLRKARRKTTRIHRRLQLEKTNGFFNSAKSEVLLNKGESKGDLSTSNINTNINSVDTLTSRNTKTLKDLNSYIPLEKASMEKPTYNYSVVSKRASRYRYQIYKDVLQHWYYSPFNRLLLKFDVDNFIKRQPNSHFLTGKEENLLHLRRFLLFEHYNTLRWYTNMEHYRSMKTQLNGGTKSFSSRLYNQQFFGTFKKIRHLFAITPSVSTISNLSLKVDNLNPNMNINSLTETDALPFPQGREGNKDLSNLQKNFKYKENAVNQTNVLKFDQLLYNEYPNNKDNPLLNPLIIHEELLPDYVQKTNKQKDGYDLNQDLLSQSQEIVRKYLIETRSTRHEYIKKLLNENNYSTLTQFIYNGQKTRGNQPITNQNSLNNQEKEYLLTSAEKKQIENELNSYLLTDYNLLTKKNENLNEQLYLIYLKNWKRRINDQQSVTNYLSRRLEKRKKRKEKKEQQLLSKLKYLQKIYSIQSTSSIQGLSSQKNSLRKNNKIQSSNYTIVANNSSSDLLTSGLQKSILEGMYVLNNLDQKAVPAEETNLWKVLLLSKIKQKQNFNINQSYDIHMPVREGSTFISTQNNSPRLQDITLRFNDLQIVKKIQLSNHIKTTIQTIRKIIKKTHKPHKLTALYNSIQNKLARYRKKSLNIVFKAKRTLFNLAKITLTKNNLLKPIKRKSFKDWRQKQRVLGRQKRLRKEFKLINAKFGYALRPIIRDKNKVINIKEDGEQDKKEGGEQDKKEEGEQAKKDDGEQDKIEESVDLGETLTELLAKDSLGPSNSQIKNNHISQRSSRLQTQILPRLSSPQNNIRSVVSPSNLQTKNDEILSGPSNSQTEILPGSSLQEEDILFSKKMAVWHQDPIYNSLSEIFVYLNTNVFDNELNEKANREWIKTEEIDNKDESIQQQISLIRKYAKIVNHYETLNKLSALENQYKKSNMIHQNSSQSQQESNTIAQTNDFVTKFNANLYGSKKRQNLVTNEEKDRKKNSSKDKAIKNLFKNIRSSLFKRKPGSVRRSGIRRTRGVFKKNTLEDLLLKYAKKIENQTDVTRKSEYIPEFKKSLLGISLVSTKGTKEIPLKIRTTKEKKDRYFKLKRAKFSQKRRKYRKRRRDVVSKIRDINKQFKRVQNQITVKNWWWSQYLPYVQASNEAGFKSYRDQLIKEKLSPLSLFDILERDESNNSNFNILQIGNKDFKPLMIPQAIRIIEATKLKQENYNLSLLNQDKNLGLSSRDSQNIVNKTNTTNPLVKNKSIINKKLDKTEGMSNTHLNLINKLYESLFIKDMNTNFSFNEFLLPNTNLPFYAGWDESLRKLIVTNRMLSRKDAGFTLYNNFDHSAKNTMLNNISQIDNLLEFTSAPLQGMNAPTTLYWQIPFTTYDPDQFFALGLDGFSPLGWRKFLFRHSILKTWLDLRSFSEKSSIIEGYKNSSNENLNQKQMIHISSKYSGNNSSLIVKNSNNIINEITNFGLTKQEILKNNILKSNLDKQQKIAFATSRRLKKRYRKVKKHPKTPVWYPSGPLTKQVLPVHYIYVFYKRSRLTRDRYIKRRLLKSKNPNNTFINNFMQNNLKMSNSFSHDFTLRKRLKPKRKYHIKRDYYASNVIIPRRLKFMGINQTNTDLKMWRPLSSLKIHKPISEVVKEQLLLRRSISQKQRSTKQVINIRVKQLRRRVHRQILRTSWRYRPRAGGFVWPGDYFKLELVKAPRLELTESKRSTLVKDNLKGNNKNSQLAITSGKQVSVRKQKRKKKRNFIEWQVQPKKFLYEKHNLKVLKKKLQKAQRSIGGYEKTLNILRNSI